MLNDFFLVLFLFIALCCTVRKSLGSCHLSSASFLGVIAVKCLLVWMVFTLWPARVTSTDGERYLYEIISISRQPFLWDVFAGAGPHHYQVSPKLGMSFLYGLIAFVFGSSPLVTIFSLNIFFTTLASLFCASLARSLTVHKLAPLIVFLAVNLHPEVLFWNSLIVRESMCFALVCGGIYYSYKLFVDLNPWNVLSLVAIVVATYVTRVQLVMVFLVFVGIYFFLGFGKKIVCSSSRNLKNLLASFVFLSVALMLFLEKFIDQLKGAAGSMVDVFSWNLDDALSHLQVVYDAMPRILSLAPQHSYGALGLFLIPISLFTFLGVLLFVSQMHFCSQYKTDFKLGVALLILSMVFFVGLAIAEILSGVQFQIRFRVPMTPLLLCVSTAAWLNVFIKNSATHPKQLDSQA